MDLKATRRERLLKRKLHSDLKLLATFVRVYCRSRHRAARKAPVTMKGCDVAAISGRQVVLCDACRKLLIHGIVMRTLCPFDPKPACKKCPAPCYAPRYRQAMREVMKYSGRRLVMTGRLHYLFHL